MSIILDGSTGITTPNIISPTQTISTKLDLTGGQIKFPATQVPSSDANTLDDYEEGTFTPSVSAASGSITSYLSGGVYVKVGKLITVSLYILITNNGTGAGSGIVSNLPFAISNGVSAVTRSAGYGGWTICFEGFNNTTLCSVYKYDNSYPWGTNSAHYMSFSYLTI